MASAVAVSERARAAMRRGVVWENHCCVDFDDMEAQLDGLARYRHAGVDAVHLNVGASDEPLDKVMRNLAYLRSWVRARPDRYVLSLSVSDIERAKTEGKLALCFNVEGAHTIGEDLGLVELYYELGVRWMAMVYNRENAVGAGCHDAEDRGLTALGRKLVEEMDRVGIVKDIAHTGQRTAMDVCVASSLPVTISHSNPRALKDHPRCVRDELMQACASTGGVLGISGVGIFLGDNDSSTVQIARSVEYAVDLMGIDHVGIGTDFTLMLPGKLDRLLAGKRNLWPEGYGYEPGLRIAEPEQFPELADALLHKGYSEADLSKLFGGNFMRVAREVWKDPVRT